MNAFPTPISSEMHENRDGGQTLTHECAEGMSLRDYFAARAMQAIITRSVVDKTPDEIAHFAYVISNAMLKESETYSSK